MRLYRNELSGELEDRFSGSFNLRVLSLWNNFFNGTVPLSLGDLENLGALELDGNQLVGEIPELVCDLLDTGFLSFVSADCDAVNCPCCHFCCYQDRPCEDVVPQRRLETSPLSKGPEKADNSWDHTMLSEHVADRPGSIPLKQRSTRRLEASTCPVRYIWRAATGELEFAPF